MNITFTFVVFPVNGDVSRAYIFFPFSDTN